MTGHLPLFSIPGGGGGGGDFNPSCQGSYGQNMPLWHGQHSGKVTVLQNAKRPTALATT